LKYFLISEWYESCTSITCTREHFILLCWCAYVATYISEQQKNVRRSQSVRAKMNFVYNPIFFFFKRIFNVQSRLSRGQYDKIIFNSFINCIFLHDHPYLIINGTGWSAPISWSITGFFLLLLSTIYKYA
jgi:hypothetical protein